MMIVGVGDEVEQSKGKVQRMDQAGERHGGGLK